MLHAKEFGTVRWAISGHQWYHGRHKVFVGIACQFACDVVERNCRTCGTACCCWCQARTEEAIVTVVFFQVCHMGKLEANCMAIPARPLSSCQQHFEAPPSTCVGWVWQAGWRAWTATLCALSAPVGGSVHTETRGPAPACSCKQHTSLCMNIQWMYLVALSWRDVSSICPAVLGCACC